MTKHQYSSFIGKTKTEIMEELGHDFNYYPSNIWTYEISKNWLGKRKFLLITFENEIAKNIKIQSCYGKFNSRKL